MSDYAPNRKFINVDGQDVFPIRLSGDRMAWLVLPKHIDIPDIERIVKNLDFIVECSADHQRNPGPPEPNGRLP